jgi:hypothetical protein
MWLCFKIQCSFQFQRSADLLLLAHSDGVLRLREQRVVIVVRVRGERVADFLTRALVGLGLECGGDAVPSTLEVIAELLGGRLLAVGLNDVRSDSGTRS